MNIKKVILQIIAILIYSQISYASNLWQAGAAKENITGPVYGRLLMGYANPLEWSDGFQMPLFARVLLLKNISNGKMVAFVNLDLSQSPKSLRLKVLAELKSKYPELEISDQNLMMSATHSHASQGGFSHHQLYVVAAMGFDEDHTKLIVQQVVRGIYKAYQNLTDVDLLFSQGELKTASQNRSPLAFAKNPEKDQFPLGVTTNFPQIEAWDKKTGKLLAVWNVFAVHGTSWSRDNKYISGDNKGWASNEVESNTNAIAMFANGAAGDVSVNPLARESEDAEFQALKSVGHDQAEESLRLIRGHSEKKSLGKNFHSKILWTVFPGYKISANEPDGENQICEPAIGYSMMAGALDGRSPLLGLKQGLTSKDPVPLISKFLLGLLKWSAGFTYDLNKDCHEEKNVAYFTRTKNGPGTPRVLPIQAIELGDLAIVTLPFEPSTISADRVQKTYLSVRSPEIKKVIVAGYTNAYSGYLTTPEEYRVQLYEGASNHFGPHSLEAVQAMTKTLAENIENKNGPPGLSLQKDYDQIAEFPGNEVPKGTMRSLYNVDFYDKAECFLTSESEVEFSNDDAISPGEELEISFWAGNPNSVLASLDYSKLPISVVLEHMSADSQWEKVMDESDPRSLLKWQRSFKHTKGIFFSRCWDIEAKFKTQKSISSGTYRVIWSGNAVLKNGKTLSYTGSSKEIKIRGINSIGKTNGK